MLQLKHFLIALLFGFCVSVPQAPAEEDASAPAEPLPGEAVKLGEIFHGEVVRIAQLHVDSVKTLPAIQQAQLLALQKKLQESGDLDGYLAIIKERKRFTEALKAEPDPFEKIPELPDSALVEKPDVLRALQDQYIKAHKDKLDLRNKRVEDLTRTYLTQLDNLKTDLTIKGRIKEAVIVKKEIERIKKGLEDKTFVPQALSAVPATKAAPISTTDATASNAAPVFGKVPDWATWSFDRTGKFSGDAAFFAHPDLPDQLEIEFIPKVGRGRISGRCDAEPQTVNMRECAWFGKAIQWKVKDLNTLNASFSLQSRELAASQSDGPKVYLLLQNEKGPLGESLEVPLSWKDITLTITKDPGSNRCALVWPQGKIKKIVELPAGSTVRVLLGICLRNQGELCDTTLVMQ